MSRHAPWENDAQGYWSDEDELTCNLCGGRTEHDSKGARLFGLLPRWQRIPIPAVLVTSFVLFIIALSGVAPC